MLSYIKKRYFMPFCCLFLKSSKAIGVSLSIDGKQCVNLFFQAIFNIYKKKLYSHEIAPYLIMMSNNLVSLAGFRK